MATLQSYRNRDPFALAREIFGFDPFRGIEAQLGRPSSFVPSFDLKAVDDAYVLHADMPGVKEEEVDISLHQNRLTISGTRIADERAEGETHYLSERMFGNFSRTLIMPDDANADAIEAHMEDGVLTVRIPKRPESQPRKIALKK
jgi:HSP20 family protein